MPFAAARMDLEMIILSEASQRKTDMILKMIESKNDTSELIHKTETDSRT